LEALSPASNDVERADWPQCVLHTPTSTFTGLPEISVIHNEKGKKVKNSAANYSETKQQDIIMT